MKKLNLAGGLIPLIIFGALLIGTIILVLDNKKEDTGNPSNQTEESLVYDGPKDNSVIESASLFVIDEWDIAVALQDSEIIEYDYSDEGGSLLTIQQEYDSSVTPRFDQSSLDEPGCEYPGLTMYRAKNISENSTSTNIRKVDSYYYFVTGAPGQCVGGSDSDLELQQRFLSEFEPGNIKS